MSFSCFGVFYDVLWNEALKRGSSFALFEELESTLCFSHLRWRKPGRYGAIIQSLIGHLNLQLPKKRLRLVIMLKIPPDYLSLHAAIHSKNAFSRGVCDKRAEKCNFKQNLKLACFLIALNKSWNSLNLNYLWRIRLENSRCSHRDSNPDLRFRKPLLYPLELWERFLELVLETNRKIKNHELRFWTRDLWGTNHSQINVIGNSGLGGLILLLNEIMSWVMGLGFYWNNFETQKLIPWWKLDFRNALRILRHIVF